MTNMLQSMRWADMQPFCCAQLKQSCKEIAPGIPPRIEGLGASHHANTDWLVSHASPMCTLE